MRGPSPAELARAFGDSPYPLDSETDVPRRKTTLPRGLRAAVGGPGALARDARPTPPGPPRPAAGRGPVMF